MPSLPAYYIGNGLDFSPLDNALGRMAQQQEMAQRRAVEQQRLGMDQERLGFERQMVPGRVSLQEQQLLEMQRKAATAEKMAPYLVDEKLADIALKRSHADYYRAVGRASIDRAGTSRDRAENDRARIFQRIFDRLGPNPTQEAWDAESRPGGLIFAQYGGPVPYDQRGRVLDESKFRRSAGPDDQELFDRGFTQQQIQQLRRREAMRKIAGPARTGYEFDFDERGQLVEKPISDRSTATERQAALTAEIGMKSLQEARARLSKTNSLQQYVGDEWTIPGTKMTVGGYGPGGDAFLTAKTSVLNLLFALSGKQVSNAERDTFMRLYMPSSTDRTERQNLKFDQMEKFFRTVMDARKRGATDDDVAKLFRDRLTGPADAPPPFPRQQQPAPRPAPTGQPAQRPDLERLKKRWNLD